MPADAQPWWHPTPRGLSHAVLGITQVLVARRCDGGVALSIVRDGEAIHRITLDEAAAVHLAACLIGAPARVEG